ncbi:MAG: hypothetical protein Q9183_004238 [Haloplaca sp. 2 TL-2023]
MTTIGAVSGKRDTPITQDVERRIHNTNKRPHGTSIAVLVQTAWSLVLSRISNSKKADHVIFGSMVSGREAPFADAADVVGPTLNLVPVRMRIEPQQSCTIIMHQAHQQHLAMMPYVATPIEKIMSQSPWPKSTRFGSVVLHQNLPRTSVVQDGDNPGERKWRYVGAAVYGGIMMDITDVWLTTIPSSEDDEKGSMRCWLSFTEDAMDTAKANAMIDCFVNVLGKILEHPHAKVEDLMMSFDRSVLNEDLQCPAAEPTSTSYPSSAPDSEASRALIERLRALWISALPSNSSTPEGKEEELPIDTTTNFFDLGGDSLSAAVLARASKSSDLDLSLQDIYDFSTLEAQSGVLLGYIERLKREKPKLVFVSEEDLTA